MRKGVAWKVHNIETKTTILREAIVDKVPIKALARKYGVSSSVITGWVNKYRAGQSFMTGKSDEMVKIDLTP
jgi:transposase-like protein